MIPEGSDSPVRSRDARTLWLGRRFGKWSADTALHGQLLRFAASTGLSASITVGLPLVLHGLLDVAARPSVSLALTTAFVVNFFVVRRFVFARSGAPAADFLRFGLSSLVFRFLEYGLFTILYGPGRVPFLLATLAVLATSSVAKFFVFRFIVFPPPRGAAAGTSVP